ncbi:hypothetical protein FRC07_006434, partial [Ceratobasidium sp. 392]
MGLDHKLRLEGNYQEGHPFLLVMPHVQCFSHDASYQAPCGPRSQTIAYATNTAGFRPSNPMVGVNYPGVIPTVFQLLAKKCFAVSNGLHLPSNITSAYCFRRLVLDEKAAGATDDIVVPLEDDWVHVNEPDVSMSNKPPISV